MITADITKNGKSKGNILILETSKEGQLIIEALEFYCKHHGRKVFAKKMLKSLSEDLGCF